MVKLYVEGGGQTAALKAECREGFRTFITKTGLVKRPRIVACGGRTDAYNSYCTALANGEPAILLVDSEAPIAAHLQKGEPSSWKPWQHLKERPGDCWEKPTSGNDMACHLVVQCMETWFLADLAVLEAFFGQGFKPNQMPAAGSDVESIAKVEVYDVLGKV